MLFRSQHKVGINILFGSAYDGEHILNQLGVSPGSTSKPSAQWTTKGLLVMPLVAGDWEARALLALHRDDNSEHSLDLSLEVTTRRTSAPSTDAGAGIEQTSSGLTLFVFLNKVLRLPGFTCPLCSTGAYVRDLESLRLHLELSHGNLNYRVRRASDGGIEFKCDIAYTDEPDPRPRAPVRADTGDRPKKKKIGRAHV